MKFCINLPPVCIDAKFGHAKLFDIANRCKANISSDQQAIRSYWSIFEYLSKFYLISDTLSKMVHIKNFSWHYNGTNSERYYKNDALTFFVEILNYRLRKRFHHKTVTNFTQYLFENICARMMRAMCCT